MIFIAVQLLPLTLETAFFNSEINVNFKTSLYFTQASHILIASYGA